VTIERGIRLVAGSAVLLTVAMSHPRCWLYVSEHMLWVTTFVGFMLAQSSITGFCPMASILKKLGLESAA
jgi:hypothetical protein